MWHTLGLPHQGNTYERKAEFENNPLFVMTVQLEQELTEHRKENSGTWLLRYDLGHGKPIFHAKSVKKKRCWTVPLWVLFGRRNIAPNRNDNPFFPSSTEGYRFFLTCLKFTDCWKSFIFSGKISKGHTVFFIDCPDNHEKKPVCLKLTRVLSYCAI